METFDGSCDMKMSIHHAKIIFTNKFMLEMYYVEIVI